MQCNVALFVGLFPNRLQVCRSVLTEEALDFFGTEDGPDATRFGQGRARFYLAVELGEDPGSYDARRVEAAVTPRRRGGFHQGFLEASCASERVGEDHAPERQTKILGA